MIILILYTVLVVISPVKKKPCIVLLILLLTNIYYGINYDNYQSLCDEKPIDMLNTFCSQSQDDWRRKGITFKLPYQYSNYLFCTYSPETAPEHLKYLPHLSKNLYLLPSSAGWVLLTLNDVQINEITLAIHKAWPIYTFEEGSRMVTESIIGRKHELHSSFCSCSKPVIGTFFYKFYP